MFKFYSIKSENVARILNNRYNFNERKEVCYEVDIWILVFGYSGRMPDDV